MTTARLVSTGRGEGIRSRILVTTGIFGIASICGFASNLVLAHALPPAGYAAYALLFSLYACAGLLGDAGIKQKHARFFLKADLATYRWGRIVLGDLPVSAMLVGLFAGAAAVTYPALGPLAVGLAALASLCYVISQWLCMLLRSVTQAWWLALLQRGMPLGVLLLVPLIVRSGHRAALAAGGVFLGVSLVLLVLDLSAARSLLPSGNAPYPQEARSDGRAFTWMLMFGALFFYSDRFLVARLAPAREFAAYSLVAVFFQVFDLLLLSSDFLLSPFYARHPGAKSGPLLRTGLAVVMPVAALLVMAVPPLVLRFYPRYYPVNLLVLLGFAIAGSAKVLSNVVMTSLNINATSAVLRRYVAASCVFLPAGILAVAMAAMRFGAAGASLAVAGVWSGRLLIAAFFERTGRTA